MSTVNNKLLDQNRQFERDLNVVANRYMAMRDARWMFARAHENIMHQINVVLTFRPDAFRNPDQLIRFNISFASAFLAAVAKATGPWRTAFAKCAVAEASYAPHTFQGIPADPTRPFGQSYELPHSDDPNAVKICAIAMADAHINTDIVAALKTIGCIDPNDYGNILLFVERGSHDAILGLHGRMTGPIYDALKRWLLPLDKLWRNSVYAEVCLVPVPNVETAFKAAVDDAIGKMGGYNRAFIDPQAGNSHQRPGGGVPSGTRTDTALRLPRSRQHSGARRLDRRRGAPPAARCHALHRDRARRLGPAADRQLGRRGTRTHGARSESAMVGDQPGAPDGPDRK